ncbi:3-hydroxybutyryl-CoA dehydrogenase [bacterium]|nr:3-hydroxybutyryl-CoA dehydrogenase [bacterium]
MKQIGIAGAGAMGSGIAQVAAQAGEQVIVYDLGEEMLHRAEQQMKAGFEARVQKQKMTSSEAEAILSRIRYTTRLQDLAEVDWMIEAVVEKLEVKKAIFSEMEALSRGNALLASNTSSLSIAAIGQGLNRPEQLIGLHFFNPAPVMPLVEVVASLRSDTQVVQSGWDLVNGWGKTAVRVQDTPGFIVNRLARPFYAEALKMLEEGFAEIDEIDAAMRSRGFRMGPFELMDLIGHDVNYAVSVAVWEQFYCDPRFRPSMVQKRMVESGLLGRKSGKGFYPYPRPESPAVSVDAERAQRISNRILVMLINEAADALFRQVASATDLDLAMTQGVNYPKGLLAWADEMGIETVLQSLENLHHYFGDDRYRPCPLLRELHAHGKTFHG